MSMKYYEQKFNIKNCVSFSERENICYYFLIYANFSLYKLFYVIKVPSPNNNSYIILQ